MRDYKRYVFRDLQVEEGPNGWTLYRREQVTREAYTLETLAQVESEDEALDLTRNHYRQFADEKKCRFL